MGGVLLAYSARLSRQELPGEFTTFEFPGSGLGSVFGGTEAVPRLIIIIVAILGRTLMIIILSIMVISNSKTSNTLGCPRSMRSDGEAHRSCCSAVAAAKEVSTTAW